MKGLINVNERRDVVIADITELFLSKATVYGSSRFYEHSDQFDFWMCFSDIHRKTLRLEQLTIAALHIVPGSSRQQEREKLIDDYKDIANYAIMAVMKLEEVDDEV